MPSNFKKLVRARMAITGESWATAARAAREYAQQRDAEVPTVSDVLSGPFAQSMRDSHARGGDVFTKEVFLECLKTDRERTLQQEECPDDRIYVHPREIDPDEK